MCACVFGGLKDEVAMETSFPLLFFPTLSFTQTHMHTHTPNAHTVSPGIDKQRTGSVFTFHGPSNP